MELSELIQTLEEKESKMIQALEVIDENLIQINDLIVKLYQENLHY
jgi:hypothetical protein